MIKIFQEYHRSEIANIFGENLKDLLLLVQLVDELSTPKK